MNNLKIVHILYFISLALLVQTSRSYAESYSFDKGDDYLTAKVQAKIAANPILAPFKINVTTASSVVRIEGQVDTVKEANDLIILAKSITGVEAVDASGIVVKETKIKPALPCQQTVAHPKAIPVFSSDSLINSQIIGLYLREGLIDKNNPHDSTIHIHTKRGIVYLSGTVANPALATKAVSLAESISGVALVESTLAVKK